jgi:hypothetical protein
MIWGGILHADKRLAQMWQGYAVTPAIFSPWGGKFTIAFPGMRITHP